MMMFMKYFFFDCVLLSLMCVEGDEQRSGGWCLSEKNDCVGFVM